MKMRLNSFSNNLTRLNKPGIILLLLMFCLSPLLAGPCGDVNSSGKIDIVDALMTAQYYVGLNPDGFDIGAADVNGDGMINIVDALILAQYYVGLLDNLPGCVEATPTPTQSTGNQLYELQAETEATWDNATVDTNQAGFTGTGFVNTVNTSGTWIEWEINVGSATNALCEFTYACAAEDRAMDLTVNGTVVKTVAFPATGAWTTWSKDSATFGLIAGLNKIRLTAKTSGGAPNMDKMDITIGGTIITPTPIVTPTPSPTPTPTPFGYTSPPISYDIVVAADGSGDYKKVQDAVNAASSGDVILVKPGTYTEVVKIKKNNLTIRGESRENTIVTNDNDFDDGSEHACFFITGNDITVVNITLKNTADSREGRRQANALYVSGDRVLFYKSNILGFQDTYRHSGGKRSYHLDCVIQGTTDFIYGDGIALFENCVIYNRKDSHVTAHAPGSKRDFGYVFKNCEIKKHPEEVVTNASLGRPWGENANVVYLNCFLEAHIRTDGWMVWNGRDTHLTAYYAEYKSTGPGANPDLRLSWTHQLTDNEATKYTMQNILKDWNPMTTIASFQ